MLLLRLLQEHRLLMLEEDRHRGGPIILREVFVCGIGFSKLFGRGPATQPLSDDRLESSRRIPEPLDRG